MVKTDGIHVASGATATDHFVLAPVAGTPGTAKLQRGDPSAATQDILGINADGTVTAEVVVPQTDDSKKVVNTGWCKFGFAASFGIVGYVKFPAWLGGWIIQWGQATNAAFLQDVAAAFSLAFPTVVYAAWVTPAAGVQVATTAVTFWVSGLSTTQVAVSRRYITGTAGPALANNDFYWYAIGK